MSTNLLERFQLYITREQRDILERLSRDRRQDMAELVREAIDRVFRTGRRTHEFERAVDATFGILKGNKDIPSGITFQNRLRRQWDRKRPGR